MQSPVCVFCGQLLAPAGVFILVRHYCKVHIFSRLLRTSASLSQIHHQRLCDNSFVLIKHNNSQKQDSLILVPWFAMKALIVPHLFSNAKGYLRLLILQKNRPYKRGSKYCQTFLTIKLSEATVSSFFYCPCDPMSLSLFSVSTWVDSRCRERTYRPRSSFNNKQPACPTSPLAAIVVG